MANLLMEQDLFENWIQFLIDIITSSISTRALQYFFHTIYVFKKIVVLKKKKQTIIIGLTWKYTSTLPATCSFFSKMLFLSVQKCEFAFASNTAFGGVYALAEIFFSI